VNNWTPLWNFCVESSLWDESDLVVKVFLTMMAIKDADHVVRFSAYQIARKARKTEVEVLEALKVLSSPDTKRLEPQEYEGRRIKAVEDGWLVLNGEKYREMVQEEMRKARNRRAQAAHRQREKEKAMKSGKPLAGENSAVSAMANGDHAAADAITTQALPETMERAPGD